MLQLGIYWGHNSNIAVFSDGRPIYASAEERYSRIKNDDRFPITALNAACTELGIEISEFDSIVYCDKQKLPIESLLRQDSTFSVSDLVRKEHQYFKPVLLEGKKINLLDVFHDRIDVSQHPGKKFWDQYLPLLKNASSLTRAETQSLGQKLRRDLLRESFGVDADRVFFADHHKAHMTYGLNMDNQIGRTLYLTLDAYGDNTNYSASLLDSGRIKCLESGNNFIGSRLYRSITLLCGMRPLEHEYKVMGLAPYGSSRDYEELLLKFRGFQAARGFGFEDRARPKDLYFAIQRELEGFRFDHVAAATQAFYEELLVSWVANCISLVGGGGYHESC